MMRSGEFVRKAEDIAKNYKTLYVSGCFGAPMTAANKARYSKNNAYNKKPERQKMIQAASADTFGFDCVCLIKGILWGWSGDLSRSYGGAAYASNGVPDIGEDAMIKACRGVTADFSGIVPGAAVWMSGHIGVYIGGGLAAECSPKWANGVQITAVGNLGKKSGYNTRTWTKWGLLPWVDYTDRQAGKEDDSMSYEQWKAYMDQYRQELGAAPAPDWSRSELEQAVGLGVSDGTRPCDFASRAEVAAMIVRAAKMG